MNSGKSQIPSPKPGRAGKFTAPKPPTPSRGNQKKDVAAKMGRIVQRYQGK